MTQGEVARLRARENGAGQTHGQTRRLYLVMSPPLPLIHTVSPTWETHHEGLMHGACYAVQCLKELMIHQFYISTWN